MAELVRDVILRDGTTLRLRAPTATDAEEIAAFFERLSPESRYLRFHGYTSPDSVVDAYAHADGHSRVALIARQAGGDGEGEGAGRIVAVAGYERLREPGAAEVAFAVADDQQGRGTGTRLLEQLAELAAARGIERFYAEVLAGNARMLRVFRNAGFDVRREGEGGEVRLALDIRPTERLAERIAARDHVATVASLKAVLAPGSVAVIGASEESVGGAILRNVLDAGFRGDVHAVRRGGGRVLGLEAAPALAEVGDRVDLAVVAVPAAEVVGVAREAQRAGVRALAVVSTGFADSGEEGRARQAELLETVRWGGMRLVGPNCLGLVNTDPGVRLDATIGRRPVRPGALAISAQSGALGIALLGHAAARGIGLAEFVSLGNRADVSTNDLLEYWEDDPRVGAVAMYVESFGNPARFSRIARRVSRAKPILAVKGNKARPGGGPADAAGGGSHTAAALRGESVVDALFRQAGVLRVDGVDELFSAAELLTGQPLPEGRRIGIVTNSGGLGTLAADACLTGGLVPATLAAATERRLRASLERPDRTGNPVDMAIGADAAAYRAAIAAIIDDDGVDAVLALHADLSDGDPGAVLAAIDEAATLGPAAKPVIASVVDGAGDLPDRPPAGPGARRVPNLRFVEACVSALARAADRRDWLARPLGQEPPPLVPDPEAAAARVREVLEDAGPGWLGHEVAAAALGAYGLPLMPAAVCTNAGEAAAAAERSGGPVALKADFPPPAHAADIDAVLLGLEGAGAVRAAWRELRRRVTAAGREWRGAIVQPLAGPGADVLVGAVGDPDLGPVIGLGLGGRQAGLATDVSFRLSPVTDVEADDLIAGSTGVTAWLEGFRGSPPLDRAALRDLVLRFAAVLRAAPELVEADLNPVRLLPEGCRVLDMRLRVERRTEADRLKTW